MGHAFSALVGGIKAYNCLTIRKADQCHKYIEISGSGENAIYYVKNLNYVAGIVKVGLLALLFGTAGADYKKIFDAAAAENNAPK